MILTGENRDIRRKACPSATLFTTNPIWIGQEQNPDLRSERPATNRLSHGTTLMMKIKCIIVVHSVRTAQ